MALADTARLIAALELQDKFSGPAKRAEGSINTLDRKMGTLSASGQKLGAGLSRAFSTIAKIGVGVGAAGVAALAFNIKAGVESLNELENVTVATNTVIKSTDGIAGQTAKGIRALSEEYEDLNATMDDKVIQSGANMLLTFTNIRTKAFEPALAAALDMNEAMGGGPEGLQSTIIQVGKALNDPIKGVTALRRVGVQLSKEQEDQIKLLVEQNDLYGAQQVILGELSTQFGGRFAAAGKTAEGQMTKLGDRIEDLQKALAGPLVPVIDRVRDKLIDFLGSPRVLRGAEQLGDAIASLFNEERLDKGVALLNQGIDLLTGKGGGGGDLTAKVAGISDGIGTIASSVAGLPWKSIGDAAKLLGTGSKALLDAFLGLPPWVQTAVLTGWGLNKLTGGALGGIVGELGKGLIKGVLNMNAAVVNVNAKAVTGVGGGVPGGGGGLAGSLLKGAVVGTGVGLAAVAAVKVVEFAGDANAQAESLRTTIQALPDQTAGSINESIAKVEKAQQAAIDGPLAGIVTELTGVQYDLKQEKAELIRTRNDLARNIVRGTDSTVRTIDRVNSTMNLERAAANAYRAADAARIQGLRDSHNAALGTLAQIRDKPSSFTTNVTVNNDLQVGISATGIAATLTRIALTTNQQQHTVPTVQ